MCKYCEKHEDWNQPALPLHDGFILENLNSNVIDASKWDGYIQDFKGSHPILVLKCPKYYDNEIDGAIYIPIKYCPMCGRKLGRSIWENGSSENKKDK